MDETDLRLLGILNTNSRMPFRELAEKLGISVQAVHKRVRALDETGVIVHYTANLSLKYLKAVPVGIGGRTKAASPSEAARGLGGDDSTSIVHVSGDYLSIMVMLRSIGDLDRYVEFVKREAQMVEMAILLPSAMGFTSPEKQSAAVEVPELTPLDFRIVRSLRWDSRKETVDIAEDVGASVKTVKRHLARMVGDGAVEFSTEFDLGAQNGTVSMVRIDLGPGSDKGRFLGDMRSRFGPRIIYMGFHSNVPDGMFMFVWSASQKVSREMEASFRENPRIAAFSNMLIQDKHQFPTWRDRLLEAGAAGAPPGK